jgi:hypothetical protein
LRLYDSCLQVHFSSHNSLVPALGGSEGALGAWESGSTAKKNKQKSKPKGAAATVPAVPASTGSYSSSSSSRRGNGGNGNGSGNSRAGGYFIHIHMCFTMFVHLQGGSEWGVYFYTLFKLCMFGGRFQLFVYFS